MRALGGMLTFLALVALLGAGMYGYQRWRADKWAEVGRREEREVRARETGWQERYHALQDARAEIERQAAALGEEARRMDQEILNLEAALAQPGELLPQHILPAREQILALRARLAEARAAQAAREAEAALLGEQLKRLLDHRGALDAELYPSTPTLRMPKPPGPDESETGAGP